MKIELANISISKPTKANTKFINIIKRVNKLYIISFDKENKPNAIPEFHIKYEFKNGVK